MLSLNSWRTLCSSRVLLHPNWLMTNRHSGHIAVSAHNMSIIDVSVASKQPWHSKTTCKARGQGRKVIIFPTSVISPRNYCTGPVKLKCWNCKQPLERTPAFFCLSCKVIQPPGEGTSYFKIMDCDYAFTLDTQKLQRRYVQLQRSLHPDNFSQRSVEEQKYSEIQSALVNKAYKTLLKPLSRGLYMLELEGMRIDEGTDSEAGPEFLMELMEINEALDEAQMPEEANKIGRDMKGKLANLTKEIDAALLQGDLRAARALLAQMKYYANIEEKVKEKLSEFM